MVLFWPLESPEITLQFSARIISSNKIALRRALLLYLSTLSNVLYMTQLYSKLAAEQIWLHKILNVILLNTFSEQQSEVLGLKQKFPC